jgi:hypothetical protein
MAAKVLIPPSKPRETSNYGVCQAWVDRSRPQSFAGRTAIVTGANSGLGEVTAREFAWVVAHVILAVPSTEKG